MKTFKATYDGEKVLFEKKADIPKDSKLIVILLDEEDTDWYTFSAQNLSRAYGKDEPDYSTAKTTATLQRLAGLRYQLSGWAFWQPYPPTIFRE